MGNTSAAGVGGAVMWTRDQAIRFVVSVERALNREWHAAIAGSVLFRGSSDHDLDIIVWPRESGANVTSIFTALDSLGLTLYITADQMLASRVAQGSCDTKHVEVWHCPDARRVSVVVLK